jgi:hypothetical protein
MWIWVSPLLRAAWGRLEQCAESKRFADWPSTSGAQPRSGPSHDHSGLRPVHPGQPSRGTSRRFSEHLERFSRGSHPLEGELCDREGESWCCSFWYSL